jgi:hypothetical protein
MHSFAVLFTSLSKLSKHAGENHFPEQNRHSFDFSSSDCNLQGHVPRTGGGMLLPIMQLQNLEKSLSDNSINWFAFMMCFYS